MKQIPNLTIFFAWVLFSTYLKAHHAMEFIDLEGYSTAHKGEWIIHFHYDYMVEDADNPRLDHWEYTPGMSYGINNRLMFDVHTHYAKFGMDHLVDDTDRSFEPDGPSPFMEAIAGSLQYRVTTSSPVQFALACHYEMPFSRSEELLGGEEVWGGTAIISHEFGNHKLACLNVTVERECNETFEEWAFGIKSPFTEDPHGISGGLEFRGDFEDEFSTLAGLYIPLMNQRMVLKTGLELGSGGERSRVNVTLMYRF